MGANKNEIKDATKKRLIDMESELMDFDNISADDMMMNPGDIPNPGGNIPGLHTFKTPAEKAESEGILHNNAKKTVVAIAKNYIKQDKFDEISVKTADVVDHQVTILKQIDYLISECKEMATIIRGYIDSGDLSQQMFSTHRGYMTDLKSYMKDRMDAIKDFEKYWKELAANIGYDKSEEETTLTEKTMSKDKEADDNAQEESEEGLVMTQEKLLKLWHNKDKDA